MIKAIPNAFSAVYTQYSPSTRRRVFLYLLAVNYYFCCRLNDSDLVYRIILIVQMETEIGVCGDDDVQSTESNTTLAVPGSAAVVRTYRLIRTFRCRPLSRSRGKPCPPVSCRAMQGISKQNGGAQISIIHTVRSSVGGVLGKKWCVDTIIYSRGTHQRAYYYEYILYTILLHISGETAILPQYY